ncbi:MobC family plasmid mobilization relaxosome protein, partial [Microbacteriaceae bacterium K1510]|nr:MobC family plasmid mobilization relaxosome protein [Microbacteriaceae bacterium K1510]
TGLRTNRVRSYMTDGELETFKRLCAAHATTEAQMIRTLVAAAAKKQAPPSPPPQRARQMDELIHLINGLHLQLRKIGGNLNQIAHQANTG